MFSPNLYVHFPFCRRKCTYCALHSRPGSSLSERNAYARKTASAIAKLPAQKFSTVYFGGGSPALCNLETVFKELRPYIEEGETEFTVELHPLDVRPALLDCLKSGGVNRISMGVQSLDDAILVSMGRGYGADFAERAFARVKTMFPNAGIDLIAGYPRKFSGEPVAACDGLLNWGLEHASVYTLILEEESALGKSSLKETLPSDDEALEEFYEYAGVLERMGLRRYEISNFSLPGKECRHNMSVWRGEDYIGIGEGAHGRIGLVRTKDWFGPDDVVREKTTAERDSIERRIFRLRTCEGLDVSGEGRWAAVLDGFAAEGLLEKSGSVFRLTRRGAEVCDSILARLV